MGFIDDLEVAPPTSKVERALNELPPDVAADVRVALADTRYSSAAIARQLTKRGHRMSESAVKRYRAGMNL